MTWLGWIALFWTWVLVNTTAVALIRAWRFWHAREPSDGHGLAGVRVLLVRPCAGVEDSLAENLSSVLAARRSFDLEVCFSLESKTDTAAPSVEQACVAVRQAGVPCHVVVGAARGPNCKASQLAAVVEQLTGGSAGQGREFQLLLSADSDVDLTDTDLDALVAPLVDGSTGATWAPFVEQTLTTFGDRMSAALLRSSLHGFVLLAGIDRKGLVGKLFGCRLDALGKVGGFGRLTAQLGEDMELARRLRQAGFRTLACPVLARSRATGRSVWQAATRYARWLAVIRAQRPWLLPSYPTLFLGTWPLILVAAALFARAPLQAGISVLAVLAARWLTALLGRRLSAEEPNWRSSIADLFLADALLGLAFARACTTRRVEWRGNRFTVGRSGLLRAR